MIGKWGRFCTKNLLVRERSRFRGNSHVLLQMELDISRMAVRIRPQTHRSRTARHVQGMELTHAFGRGILLWQIVLRLRTALKCIAREQR